MRKGLLFILLLSIFTPVGGFTQLLKGRVLSEKGFAAANIKVQFQNKANAISTNDDGSFTIMATKLPDTLVFSGLGFEPYKVVITEKNIKDPHFEVVLLNTRAELSEVVVTSYGISRKKEVTGAVSSYDDMPAALSGRAAGVSVKRKESAAIVYGYATTSGDHSGEASGKSLFFTDTGKLVNGGSIPRSKILTAGEVNDFNKWKMWEDFTDNEFKSMSTLWGMRARNRYSVQLTDSKRNAIINEKIYLINKNSGDTVWRAWTDNTGKAELWAGFFSDSTIKDNYFIAGGNDKKIEYPVEFANGINLMTIDKSCQITYDADIAFVVDATGSMGDEIEFLKLELEDVIRNTMEKYKSLTLRAASVFYRDKGDEYLTKSIPFNDDLLKTINFIKLQSAGGGGDNPEAVDEALSVALDSLQWNKSARARLLFLILDAPPHDEAKERIKQLTLKAAAMGIRIIPLACSGTDKPTEFLLRSIALATNGTYAFLTDHSGIGNNHIEPTTDKYEVELLNNLMQRIIGQYLYAKDCSSEQHEQVQETRQPDNILSVKIYPNPTSGKFIIESKKDIKEIYITDFTGKIIMRLSSGNKKGKWDVDISRYPSGSYIVKYITEDNKWGANKVVLIQ